MFKVVLFVLKMYTFGFSDYSLVFWDETKKKRERMARPVVFTEGNAQIILKNCNGIYLKKSRPVSRILFTLNLNPSAKILCYFCSPVFENL